MVRCVLARPGLPNDRSRRRRVFQLRLFPACGRSGRRRQIGARRKLRGSDPWMDALQRAGEKIWGARAPRPRYHLAGHFLGRAELLARAPKSGRAPALPRKPTVRMCVLERSKRSRQFSWRLAVVRDSECIRAPGRGRRSTVRMFEPNCSRSSVWSASPDLQSTVDVRSGFPPAETGRAGEDFHFVRQSQAAARSPLVPKESIPPNNSSAARPGRAKSEASPG